MQTNLTQRTLSKLVLTSLLIVASTAPAAVLLSMRQENDGSSDPPGDRVDLVVVFLPGEKSIDLELRGFARLAQSPRTVGPLPAKDPRTGQALEQYKDARTVARPADSSRVAVSFVIPFARLRLAPGLHRVGYEVKGTIGGKTQFVQATSLTPLQVTRGTRTEMRKPFPAPTFKQVPRKEIVTILKDGKLRTTEGSVAGYEFVFSDEPNGLVRVNIPGEFQHPLLMEGPPMTPKAGAPEDGLEPEVDELEDKMMSLPPPGAAWSSADKFLPEHERTIYFATNRTITKPNEKSIARYGNSAGDLSYGTALVNIPLETHQRGELETPGYWSTPDPKKHFLVQKLDPLALETFQDGIAEGDVLLYVHGYNTSFEFAVLRGAQLAHDLQFPGRAVAYSWPSAGSIGGYAADEEQAAKSSKPLATLLEQIRTAIQQKPGRKIHAIAHSMGNRVFLAGVRSWELTYGKEVTDQLFGQVMLAAPDVDAATFAALIPSVIKRSDRATLYYCPHDTALMASQALHVNKPVGLGPFFTEGLDTINADQVDTSIIGHGYYAAARELLLDLRLLLSYSQSPDERRPPLGERAEVYGYPLWAFVPIAQ